jgi:hypothetical protein
MVTGDWRGKVGFIAKSRAACLERTKFDKEKGEDNEPTE